jgi:N-acetyl-gamma-glutamyl-phosphate reductase
MKNIRAGIIGGAGYTGGELIRILMHHPSCEIIFIHSKSNAGNYVYNIHTDLLGITDVKFTNTIDTRIDVLFLCLGHGDSSKFLEANKIKSSIKIVDLSQDFRVGSNTFIYGLPEFDKTSIRAAQNIANPGCFATGIQLALLPLAFHGKLSEEIHVSAITGSTGAGQKLMKTTHFSWRNNNISAYKIFTHQHLKEIYQTLTSLQKTFKGTINFIPFRGNFTRGILSAVYMKTDYNEQQAYSIYENYYHDHPFVHISHSNPDVKQVVNTNNCILYLEKHDDKLIIISVIDNLIKGASGQAVQNMNLMFGLDEDAGLRFKPIAF